MLLETERKQALINTLLLKSNFINNLGLLHGKMGISICFFNLYRHTKKRIYKDFAEELIVEVYEEISDDITVDFANGLAGIGWGVEYLVQNKFVDANTDDVLKEIDKRVISNMNINSHQNLSLQNGILGIAAYLLKRNQNINILNGNRANHIQQGIINIIEKLDILLQKDVINKILLSNSSENTFPYNKEACETFNIIWDYFLLMWFLAEPVFQHSIKRKVEKILWRLIDPLNEKFNHPKLQSKKLLLVLSLTKLQQTMKLPFNTKLIAENLLDGMERDIIKSELLPNNEGLRQGISGIVLIYKQLFKLTNEYNFKKEIEYWTSQRVYTTLNEQRYSKFDDSGNNRERGIGILDGYSGIILTSI